MAVLKYNIMDPAASEFVGLGNFQNLFQYEEFWISLRNTLVFASANAAGMVPLALLVALCLAKVRRGRALYQWIVFLPVVVSLVAITLLFKWLMDPQVGLFNHYLSMVGLPRSKFLTGSNSAMGSIVMVSIWKSLGWNTILLFAGLMDIPEEMYDAAKVDGASPWQSFWRITIPLLSRTLALVLVMLGIGGLQAFVLVMLLPPGAGGPGRATSTLNLMVYQEGFQSMLFGLATAISFVLFVLILAITIVQLRLLRARWTY
jgi:ABC-type sugar transport system permease subunit